MLFRSIFWDVDGTLAETELEGHRLAFNAAFAEASLPWQWDRGTYRRWLAVPGGRERIAGYLASLEARTPSEELLDQLVAAKQRHYANLLRQGTIQLRDGVARLISTAAAAGVRQVIVTTSSRAAVNALLAGALQPHGQAFEACICGDDVLRKKPHPEGYSKALMQTGVDPAHVVALEDSKAGLAAATGASLTTVLTRSEVSVDDSLEAFGAAAAVLDGLGEPHKPARLLRGPACPEGMVSLSWLESLLP